MMFVSRLWRATALLALAGSMAGCTTLTRGVRESWAVNTVPPGASIKTSTGRSCDATPCTLRLKRKTDFDVTITKAGYQTAHAQVSHRMARGGKAALFGNAVFGGVIGAITDATNGSTMELTPNPLTVTLTPDPGAAPPAAQAAAREESPTPRP